MSKPYNMHCPILRSGNDPEKLPVVCGDEYDNWKIRVRGVDRWFSPVVAGDHMGYEHEQPIIDVDGVRYRVGMGLAWRVQ